MAPLSQAQVATWVEDFMEAMQSPCDWKKLQELMNKRCTVEMPDEPKCKKFDDWKKKAEPFFNSFKAAKRTMPKGTRPIIVQSKKDEVEVIYAEQLKFTWTKGLEDTYPNGRQGQDFHLQPRADQRQRRGNLVPTRVLQERLQDG